MNLAREVLLPKFKIPADFKTENSDDLENEYLKFLTFNGAKKHYKNLDKDLNERILFELNVIKSSGYPGYFLIVQDLIKAAY
jgi:DNA polymerase-3 subunit alpha